MEQLGIDIIGGGTFPKTRHGFRYILSIIDHFTKWAVAVPLHDQRTETVVQALVDHWVTKFGVPMRIHSDRGLMFESEVFHSLCRLLRIHKTQTTPYRPQSDGTTERFNRTVKDMLIKTATHHPEEWDLYLNSVMMAYNSSVHSTTGYSPYYLLFGRSMRFPLDITVDRPAQAISVHNYAVDLVAQLEYAHDLARKNMHLVQDRAKDRYDAGAVEKKIKVGHFVRVFNPKPKRGVPFKFHLSWSEPMKSSRSKGLSCP